MRKALFVTALFLFIDMILFALAELGQIITHFHKDGDFIIVFFFITIVAGVFTLGASTYLPKNYER